MNPGVKAVFAALLLAFAAPAVAQPGLEQLYRSGVAAFQQGRVPEALELLGAVAAQNPGYRDVQLLLGQGYLVAGLHVAAKKHFERVLEADPRNGHAAFLLGLALYQSSRYFEADEALERAHALAPQNPHPRIYRGLALLKLGRLGEARGEIEAALAIAPEEPTARAAAAELELAEGLFESARARLEALLKEAPGTFEYRLLLARAFHEGGRSADAVPILRELAGVPPPRSDVLYLLAQALLRSGATADGRAALARFKEQRALEERMRVLEAAVSTDPGDAESRLELVRLLLDQSLERHAFPHLAALRELAASDPRARELAAEVERRLRGGS